MSSPATEAQIRFINSLKEQREVPEEFLETMRSAWRHGVFSKVAASQFIEALKAYPAKSKAPAAATIEAPKGMHKVGEEIFKIQKSRESGRTYAKQLVEENGKWTFVYAPGAVYRLTAETVMSAEEAAKFGHLFGVCVNCAAELSDEVSIFYGYGPVCAKNHGWPYSKAEALASMQEVSEVLANDHAQARCSGCEFCDGEGADYETCSAHAEAAYGQELVQA